MIFQNLSKQKSTSLIDHFVKIVYVDCTALQIFPSNLSLKNVFSSIACINISTKVFSHSNHCLLHGKFQIQFSSTQNSTSSKVVSFMMEFKYSFSNLTIKGVSSNHLSSQNIILFPLPLLHIIFLLNQFPSFPSPHALLISLHHNESW